jgi:dihydropteroate synthase
MPRNIQKNPFYENVIKEIKDYFVSSLSKAKAAGIAMEQIVLDPGIGFGKRLEDNFEIIRHLSAFSSLNRPILIGPSRKSFIGAKLDLSVQDRLEGTLAAVTASILNGAHIIRVHDVLANKRAAIIADHIRGHVKEKND